MKHFNYPLTLMIVMLGTLSLSACDAAEEEPFADEPFEEEVLAQDEVSMPDSLPVIGTDLTPNAEPGGEGANEPVPAVDRTPVHAAIAVLHPTQGHDVTGTITFTDTAGPGLQLKATVNGLAPGLHAYHVHVLGDCSAQDASSAGKHYNFREPRDPMTPVHHILGNLGELNADANGKATAVTSAQYASLNGARAIIGRAVIVHEKGNDPSKPPAGATGARLACGVIGIAQSGTVAAGTAPE